MKREDESQHLAVRAAQLVVDEGLDYQAAKLKAQAQLGLGRSRSALPSHEQVEDEVRAHLAIYGGESQMQVLQAMRQLALRWMSRLAQADATLRPHLAGAVWRGTATALSSVVIECFADDPKGAEMALLNLGVNELAPGTGPDDSVTLQQVVMDRAVGATVLLEFVVRDADDLRGALKPDARGRTWRGSLPALQALLNHAASPTD